MTGLNITERLVTSNGNAVRILGHIAIFKPEVVRRMREDHLDRFMGMSTCPICLDEGPGTEANPVLRTCCGHALHLDCLGDMVTTHSRPTRISDLDPIKCPYCRTDILPTIIQHRHLLCHQRFFERHEALNVLVADMTDLDQMITCLVNENHEIMYYSNKTPTAVINFWESLGTGMDIPAEITDYRTANPPLDTTPQYEPTSPPGSVAESPPGSPLRQDLGEQGPQPVQPAGDPFEAPEQTAPPSTPPDLATIQAMDTPPPAPRRIRRRLNPPVLTHWERPRTLFTTVPTGTVTRAPTVPIGSVGIDLTEIIRRFNAGEHVQVFHGSNVDGSTHYSVTAVETESGQQVLTVVIQ